MAEEERTFPAASQEASLEQGAPPMRRRRRAGAPAGAPEPQTAPAAPAEERHTTVPEQQTTIPDQSRAVGPETAEEKPAAPKRRRAAAPAGPPVFQAPGAPSSNHPTDAEDAEPAEEDELLLSDDDGSTATGSASGGADGAEDAGIAGDLQALAAARTAGESAAEGEDSSARRKQAQIDFASLLFQAPAPVRRTTAGPELGSDSEDQEELDEAVREQEQEDRPSGSSRRSRSRRGRSARSADSSAEDSSGQDRADTLPERASGEGTGDPDSADAAGDADSADEDGSESGSSRRRRRRGGRGRRGRGRGDDEGRSPGHDEDGAHDARNDAPDDDSSEDGDEDDSSGSGSSRRRRRRRRSGSASEDASPDDPPNTVVKVREARDEVRSVKGSTRLEAKKQRRREGRDAGRRRTVITEAEFLARRESVKRSMVVREMPGRTQIAVLEDDILVEHYVAQKSQTSMVGNVYLGKVQNVLPSMEAAFVDIGKGRNAVLYAGEVNWDAAGLDGQPRRIELALKSGDPVLVQVTKDPIGHKGARLTSQISLPGRYVVLVPGGSMTGISRKLPDKERARLKKIMRQVIPEGAGVIVRTAAEGASEEELTRDVERLRSQWEKIQKAQKSKSAPAALSQEPDIAIKVVRDVFNEDFTSLIVQGAATHDAIHDYVSSVAPDLLERVTKHVGEKDVFAKHRIDEQLLKAMDRKVYLPSGGSLVIDRTEAMTVVDVNTGKFTGSGGSLEETVTRNNLEAAEEIVRQLRLRDTGGIIVIDFIDMVLEANRDLVLRRLVECLGRDRTKHQVAEVTSLGLVQMTRKRVGQGLVETFSHTCDACHGRGMIIDVDSQGNVVPEPSSNDQDSGSSRSSRRRGGRNRRSSGDSSSGSGSGASGSAEDAVAELIDEKAEDKGDVHRLQEDETSRALARATIASIAAASSSSSHPEITVDGQVITVGDADEAATSDPASVDPQPAEAAPAEGAPAEASRSAEGEEEPPAGSA